MRTRTISEARIARWMKAARCGYPTGGAPRQDNMRAGKKGAGDGNELLLADADAAAVAADVTSRCVHKPVDMGALAGFCYRLWWPPAVRRRCSPRGPVVEPGVLQHHADSRSQRLPAYRGDITPSIRVVRNRSRQNSSRFTSVWSCRLPSVRRSPPCYPVRPPATGRSPGVPGRGKQRFTCSNSTRPVRRLR